MEHRVTIVINDDPDANEITIRALGDHYLPAPITVPRQEFREGWVEFGSLIEGFLGRDHADRGPWK